MKIAIIGISGRMGKAILTELQHIKNASVIGGTVQAGSPDVGKDIGSFASLPPMNVSATDNINDTFLTADAIIDFSSPETTIASLEYLTNQQASCAYVIGTTGFSSEQTKKIDHYATLLPIIWSANMSIGVNILLNLTEHVARILDSSYDIEIIEAHHKHKVDAPSGTALALGNAAATGRNVNLKDVGCKARDGIIGPRPEGEIGFSTIRAADIVGEHTVMFASDGERIELTHKASNRSIFAKGAVRAAIWGSKHVKKPGLYSMGDVLFEETSL